MRLIPVAAGLLCSLATAQKPVPEPVRAATAPATATARSDLNLLGKADTASGEARRNENVQFNLIDNNALKELNVRLGTTATVFDSFRADRRYFGAEFGNRPQGPIHLAPAKPSSFHGSAFLAHGNSIFNARSFFTVGNLPPAHENQYGLSFGFKPWRGGFLSLEAGQQKIRGNVNGNIQVPLASERVPTATDPAARALIQRFLDAFPAELPNRTDINDRLLNTNSPQRINDNNLSGRLDHALTARNFFSARYTYLTQFVDAFQLVAGQNPDTKTRAQTAQISWSRPADASTVVNASILFDRVTSLLVPEPNAVGPYVNFSNVITTLGPGSTIPIDRAQNRFQYTAGFSRNRSRHSYYAGGGASRRQLNGFEASSHRGNLYFRNDFRDPVTGRGYTVMENFLRGAPSRFSGATGNAHRGYRQWEAFFYAGDSFRVSAALTLHYGVRYELTTRPNEVNRIDSIPYDSDRNNLAPQFGFAWRLPRWGIMRAAYGVQYGEIFPVTYSQMRYNPPANAKFEVQAPDLFAPFRSLNVPVDPNGRTTFLSISPELATPYAHLYNWTWEPLASSVWRVQLGYVGSRFHKLLLMQYQNRARYIPGGDNSTATITARRPDARYHDLRFIGNGSHGYFDAARVALVIPRWRGFSFETSYWLSKAIDLGAGYTNTGSGDDGRQSLAQTEFDIWRDVKSVSPYDQKHGFLLRGAYTIPKTASNALSRRSLVGNWEISAVVLVKSGTPFSVVTGSDAPGFGNVDGDQGDRPDILDPSILGRTIGHPDTSLRLLPRSAFGYIRPGEPRGNIGNNTFRKAGIGNVNASLSRTFAAGGDRRFSIRAEAVNLFNTPQFAEPWRELSSPNFGYITNTLNDGRAFRFTGRLSW